MFKLDQNADINGTCLIGHIQVSMPRMIKLFGEPKEDDGYKVSGSWTFTDDSGNVYNVYDWKMTNLYDDCPTTVDELRKMRKVTLNIGGKHGDNVAYFQSWLIDQLK